MAIITTKLKIPLSGGWSLFVVHGSNPNSEVILSFNEGEGESVRERISAHLTPTQAIQLARALAGVTTGGMRSFQDEDDEDTVP